ncbi:hypothetical protein [Rugamonas rubra]|uniref:Uncharacterized protein n=1 Tax=Rugamonas rubra TaxID=758825 RepID=A0A1I4SK47_9BURK|nr:hypothetical protein [Rugamonas rubra]SFM64751.1 hypothetical protein SAMN02982985_04823 [Rugamonas rubra]
MSTHIKAGAPVQPALILLGSDLGIGEPSAQCTFKVRSAQGEIRITIAEALARLGEFSQPAQARIAVLCRIQEAEEARGAAAPMWAARVVLEVTTATGTTERTDTGAPRATEREAMAEAEELADQLGAAVLWFGSVRITDQAKPAGRGN